MLKFRCRLPSLRKFSLLSASNIIFSLFELARFISITIKSTRKATLTHLVTKKGINLLPTAITAQRHFSAEVGPPPFLLHAITKPPNDNGHLQAIYLQRRQMGGLPLTSQQPLIAIALLPSIIQRAGMAIGPTHSSAGCFDNIVSVAGAVNFVIKIVVRFLSLPVF